MAGRKLAKNMPARKIGRFPMKRRSWLRNCCSTRGAPRRFCAREGRESKILHAFGILKINPCAGWTCQDLFDRDFCKTGVAASRQRAALLKLPQKCGGLPTAATMKSVFQGFQIVDD